MTKFHLCILIGAAAFLTAEALDSPDCNFACLDVMKPVCGSDGYIYPNKCYRDRASCESIKAGKGAITECDQASTAPKNCPVCPVYDDPVCGSDGITYTNVCELNWTKCQHPELNLTHVLDGTCQQFCSTIK
ncbi:Protease inhibitor protein [Plasmopara halstedii]|uniref:Protease inhibitor protein n=1 Tax=Plasmopara halstedii TaxID=4781 RepID=A0A0P1AJ97_PLAHL|nr:Protease inhibitor protein [Plasmopara halstedii]CEG41432.1 Protease inhibitor protein [Plasmopara halstedii]|eukprot:XP_024577801.1 Protease inhibitor protein [Plasmopara halstedii]